MQQSLLVEDQLTPSEKLSLNAPLTMEELGDATLARANDKCPGPDGTPVEFYKANWTLVGPLIHQCLSKGISDEVLPEFVTKGNIILLPKKADQRLLTNKRPITLLNTVYKIGAKAMQRRISPLLQRIISPQQAAFLPGRNIHHTLLLLAEMLHQAQQSGEEFVLMKLDVRKAFDSMEWPFILATVERAGMTGMLSSFLKASFSSASSTVILNGRPASSFKLTRSVRQGCPLSPLIFILAFDNLSLMFSAAQANRSIVGVSFPDLNIANLHSMFADDSTVLTKADMRYIMECKRILGVFGAASGLHCDWEKTKAAFIPGGPPPAALWLLPWAWEEDATATNLLGIPTASGFSVARMEQQILERVEKAIAKLQNRQLSLSGRIMAANSLILSTIWYTVTVWAGELAFLSKIQRLIEIYVWNGRSRVNRKTSTRCKITGGLGLIMVIEQYRAIAGNLMIWTLGQETHPLRFILCAHLQERSRQKWGFDDFSWLIAPGGNKHPRGSAVLHNICQAWASLKPFLHNTAPRNQEEWDQLPLWSPHTNHIRPRLCAATLRHNTVCV